MHVLPYLDLELAAVELHGDGTVHTAQHRTDRGAHCARARRHGLADAALEDPCADRGVARPRPERDVRAVGKEIAALDRGSDRRQVERVELVAILDLDRALRVADRNVLEP